MVTGMGSVDYRGRGRGRCRHLNGRKEGKGSRTRVY